MPAPRTMMRTVPWPVEAADCPAVTYIDLDYSDILALRWFAVLFKHAMRERCIRVRFDDCYDEPLSGAFATKYDDGEDEDEGEARKQDPTIFIYCPNADVTGANEIEATITLAHELGHHISWSRGDCSDDVYGIMLDDDDKPQASAELRREWLDEEIRAWRYGRELLAHLAPDFPAFDRFEAVAAEEIDGPEGYRIGLGF